jgi:hypothetical protein
MGLLVDIRESWANYLLTDQASGSATYFAADPAIPVYTEKLKTINQALTDAKTKIGLSVVIVTVVAKGAQNQQRGLYFKNIKAVARVMENPKVNMTGVCASDLAEAVAWFSRKYLYAVEYSLLLEDITLAPVPSGIAYDVLFNIEGAITTAPARPIVQL